MGAQDLGAYGLGCKVRGSRVWGLGFWAHVKGDYEACWRWIKQTLHYRMYIRTAVEIRSAIPNYKLPGSPGLRFNVLGLKCESCLYNKLKV